MQAVVVSGLRTLTRKWVHKISQVVRMKGSLNYCLENYMVHTLVFYLLFLYCPLQYFKKEMHRLFLKVVFSDKKMVPTWWTVVLQKKFKRCFYHPLKSNYPQNLLAENKHHFL